MADRDEGRERPAEVVTVTPTIMDGTVVRWYANLAAAENRHEYLSASRNAVMVDAEMKDTAEVGEIVTAIQRACDVMVRLRRGDDVRDLATHDRPFASRRLDPVLP